MHKNQQHFYKQQIVLERNLENNTIHNCFKKLKYLAINLVKEVKDLYNENYKSLKKKISEDIEDRRASHSHGSAGLIIFKWLYYPKQCVRSMQCVSKFQ
jgi:hypothetical protein